jgi:putative holliday junction resolvase
VQRILALDLGKRRTGVALAYLPEDLVMSLETIHSTSMEDLIQHILSLVQKKNITTVAVGHPLLLDGTEGSQTLFVHECIAALKEQGIERILMIDERYSSYGTTKEYADAKAACSIADVALRQLREI